MRIRVDIRDPVFCVVRWPPGQTVKNYRSFVIDISDALAIAARVGNHVRINGAPIRPEDIQSPAQIFQIVAQFGYSDQIKLAEDFRNVMNSRETALLFSKLTNIPGCNVDAFIELGGGNVSRRNALMESEQPLGDLWRNVSMIHLSVLSVLMRFAAISRPVFYRDSFSLELETASVARPELQSGSQPAINSRQPLRQRKHIVDDRIADVSVKVLAQLPTPDQS